MRHVWLTPVLVTSLVGIIAAQAPERKAGVYPTTEGAPQTESITADITSDQKVSGVWKAVVPMGFGGGPKITFAFSGAKASHRESNTRPVFYLYLPESHDSRQAMQNGEDMFMMQIRSEKDLALVALSVDGDNRLLDPKKRFESAAEKVQARVFKLTPKAALAPGEYAWAVMQGKNPAGIVFSFGVD